MGLKRSTTLFALLLVSLGATSCDSDKNELFPTQGTLRLSVVDSALVTQGSDVPGNQVMSWVIENAEFEVDGTVFDYTTVSPCDHIQLAPLPSEDSALPLSCNGAVFGFSLEAGVPLALIVRATVSAMDIRRADRPVLPPGDDFDGDRVLNDVDNCVLIPNPDQLDTSGNGFGDACSVPDSNGNPTTPDRDADGVADALDNCLWIRNPGQADGNTDGIGDDCDETATVALAGVVPVESDPVELTLTGNARSAVSLDFDHEATLTCNPAFTACTFDPNEVVLVTP